MNNFTLHVLQDWINETENLSTVFTILTGLATLGLAILQFYKK